MIVHRIARGKHKDDLSGTGAELNGGRWNNKGTKIVYTASSIALAMTEVAVHVPFGILPRHYFVVSIEVPDTEMATVSKKELMGTPWNSHPPSHITQDIGDKFVAQNKKLILKVPSVVVPGDFNYLINPLHTEFSKVKIVNIQPFGFDQRLFGSKGN
jgi:RES domain-containing protein